MRYLTRTWQHPDGWGGPGWTVAQGEVFERLMRRASRKVKGRPPVVAAWDDARGISPWYSARACPAERRLRDACRALFGARERDPHALTDREAAKLSW